RKDMRPIVPPPTGLVADVDWCHENGVMDDDRLVAVSPRHSVRLARELVSLVDHAPSTDYVVRTVARKDAGGTPLMSAEIVIAGRDARERFPLAARYPMHFRKTYTAARLQGDPAREFSLHTLA